MNNHPAAWMSGHLGIMVHYLISPPGETGAEKTQAFNSAVDAFDIDLFMEQFEQTGADWLIFTIGQNTGYYCSPNSVLDRGLPGHTSERDLALEIAKRVKASGKRFIGYLTGEVFAQTPEVKKFFAWNPADQVEFQRRYQKFVAAYAVKFGKNLDGWWFDGCYGPPDFPSLDWPAWIDAAKSGNKDAVVAFNDGSFCLGKTGPVTKLEDYMAGEVSFLRDGLIALDQKWKQPGATFRPASRFVDGVQWHALVPIDSTFLGGDPISYDDQTLADWVRSCTSVGGAVTLNLPLTTAGIIQWYPKQVLKEGQIRPETIAQLERLKKLMTAEERKAAKQK